VARGIFLKAMTDEVLTVALLEALKKSKSGKRKHRATPVPAAMVQNLTRTLQNIALDGAKGKAKAYRPVLQLLRA
jgi:hypothetical protein